MSMETFDFGNAVRRMKAGEKVRRAGWNGKGMYLFLASGVNLVPMDPGQAGIHHVQAPPSPTVMLVGASEPTLAVVPTICMRTAQDTIVPGWLASQTDILADDWQTA